MVARVHGCLLAGMCTHVYHLAVTDFPSGLEHRNAEPRVLPQPGSAGMTRPATRERLGIREFRGRLTSLVRRAGTGERIVITIAGRPVAQLGPVEPASAEVTIDDLVARGLIEPARRGDRPPPDVVVDSWTGRRLDHALREVRGA